MAVRAYWSGGKLWSRAGNVIHAPAFFTAALPADVDLDGELFLGRGKFNELMTIAKTHAAGPGWKVRLHSAPSCSRYVSSVTLPAPEPASVSLVLARGALKELTACLLF